MDDAIKNLEFALGQRNLMPAMPASVWHVITESTRLELRFYV